MKIVQKLKKTWEKTCLEKISVVLFWFSMWRHLHWKPWNGMWAWRDVREWDEFVCQFIKWSPEELRSKFDLRSWELRLESWNFGWTWNQTCGWGVRFVARNGKKLLYEIEWMVCSSCNTLYFSTINFHWNFTTSSSSAQFSLWKYLSTI